MTTSLSQSLRTCGLALSHTSVSHHYPLPLRPRKLEGLVCSYGGLFANMIVDEATAQEDGMSDVDFESDEDMADGDEAPPLKKVKADE